MAQYSLPQQINPWTQVISPDDLEAYLQGETADMGRSPASADIPIAPAPPSAVARVRGVAPKSGNSEKGTDTFHSKVNAILAKPVYSDAEELKQVSQAISQLPELQNMREGQKGLQGLLAQELSVPSQLDLSPVNSLVDAWTGSNFSKSYKPPEAPQSLRDKVLAYAEKLQGNQKDIAKALLEGVGKAKGTLTTNQLQDIISSYMKGSQDTSLHQGANPDSSTLTYMKAMQGDKSIQEADKAVNDANEVLGLLSSNQSVSNFMARIKTLRASGLNRITNLEIDKANGASDFVNRYNQAVETIMSGDLTPENIQQFITAARTLGEAAQKVSQMRRTAWKAGARTLQRVNPATIDLMAGDSAHPSLPAAPAPKKSIEDMIMENYKSAIKGK